MATSKDLKGTCIYLPQLYLLSRRLLFISFKISLIQASRYKNAGFQEDVWPMPGLTRTGPGLMMTGGYCHLSGAVYTQILPGAIAPLTPHPTLASGLFLNFLIRYLSCVWGQWGVGSGTYQVYQTDNYIANYIHQPTTYKCRCKGKIFMVCHIQVIYFCMGAWSCLHRHQKLSFQCYWNCI